MKPTVYLLFLGLFGCAAPETHTQPAVGVAVARGKAISLFDTLGLDKLGLSRPAFDLARRGVQRIKPKKPLLLIADMSQPSTAKRLYVLDLKKKTLVLQTYVAHGRESGEVLPTNFSNEPNSNQTSLGFYRAMGSYKGKHGLSLHLKGLEKGLNDNVFARNIVLHGADYVCEDTIRVCGMLGRSQGCPAVPNSVISSLIRAAEGGGCLFVYYPDKTYLATSALVGAVETAAHPQN